MSSLARAKTAYRAARETSLLATGSLTSSARGFSTKTNRRSTCRKRERVGIYHSRHIWPRPSRNIQVTRAATKAGICASSYRGYVSMHGLTDSIPDRAKIRPDYLSNLTDTQGCHLADPGTHHGGRDHGDGSIRHPSGSVACSDCPPNRASSLCRDPIFYTCPIVKTEGIGDIANFAAASKKKYRPH